MTWPFENWDTHIHMGGGSGSVVFTVGLDDLKGLFQRRWFYDSVLKGTYCCVLMELRELCPIHGFLFCCSLLALWQRALSIQEQHAVHLVVPLPQRAHEERAGRWGFSAVLIAGSKHAGFRGSSASSRELSEDRVENREPSHSNQISAPFFCISL